MSLNTKKAKKNNKKTLNIQKKKKKVSIITCRGCLRQKIVFIV